MTRKFIIIIIQLIVIFHAFFCPESATKAALIIWVSILIYLLKDLDGNFPLFSFLISFFTFLIAGLFFADNQTTTQLFLFQCHALIISLFFVFMGYLISEKLYLPSPNTSVVYTKQKQDLYYCKVRYASKRLVYFCSVFVLMEVVEQILYFRSHSYVELYSSFSGSMPYIVYKLSNLFTLSVFIYYSTLPTKSESKYVNVLFIVIPLLNFLIGKRGAAIQPLLLYISYCFIRNRITPGDKWIGRKGKLIIAVVFPFVCVLLFLMGQYRLGQSSSGLNTAEMIAEFFLQSGSSIDILGMTYEMRNQLPKSHAFLLGPLFDALYGSDIHHLFGGETLSRNTAEFAMSGKSLGSFLSYNYIPTQYFEGAGVGSCYIAESYADLRWFGVVIVSFLYGVLLFKIPKWFNRNLFLSIASFFILLSLFKAPRGQAFGFVGDLIGPTNILVVFVIHTWAKKT